MILHRCRFARSFDGCCSCVSIEKQTLGSISRNRSALCEAYLDSLCPDEEADTSYKAPESLSTRQIKWPVIFHEQYDSVDANIH
jgi:hypothetical protein